MSRFQVSIIAIVVISLITFITYQQVTVEGGLIIGLRCDDGVAGKLSISMAAKDQTDGRIEEHFNVEEVCRSGEIEFEDYPDREDVSFEYTNAQGEVTRLVSKGGDDIEVDNGHGYFVIVAIKNTSPYLVNDRL